MKRQDQSPQIREALVFMNELGQLGGEPALVLREAEQLPRLMLLTVHHLTTLCHHRESRAL